MRKAKGGRQRDEAVGADGANEPDTAASKGVMTIFMALRLSARLAASGLQGRARTNVPLLRRVSRMPLPTRVLRAVRSVARLTP